MDNSVLFSKRIISPCKDCKDRWSECHAHCEKYKEYEIKRNEHYEQKFRESEHEQEMYSIEGQRIERYKRLRSRKRPRSSKS